jgi:hypothetical protein
MEIFGGFMLMMSIIGLFVAVVWLIMPFVVFAIKGRQDRSLELLEAMDKRLAIIEDQLSRLQPPRPVHDSTLRKQTLAGEVIQPVSPSVSEETLQND